MDSMILNEIEAEVSASIDLKKKVLEDKALLKTVMAVVEVCIGAYKKGNKIILAGNGGSAADAQHIAAELVCRYEIERPGLAAIALTTDTSVITAISNDFQYNEIFSRQLEANAKEGDVFIGISTSGNSVNIVKAMRVCKNLGIYSIALTGQSGEIVGHSDYSICIPSNQTARIQECHILIGHILCMLIEEELYIISNE